MEVSPPIQFRIEWADSQGLSPLLGCRPILILAVGRWPLVVGRGDWSMSGRHLLPRTPYATTHSLTLLATDSGASTSVPLARLCTCANKSGP
jgi:hypothetical protein